MVGVAPRRFGQPSRAPATQTSVWAWIVPVTILGLMFVIARLTLPVRNRWKFYLWKPDPGLQSGNFS